jgi:hypothetical protein
MHSGYEMCSIVCCHNWLPPSKKKSKQLSKNGQKVVKKFSKSCQKVVKNFVVNQKSELQQRRRRRRIGSRSRRLVVEKCFKYFFLVVC